MYPYRGETSRDIGYSHLKAVKNGASIVRCHDVMEHYQALMVWEKL